MKSDEISYVNYHQKIEISASYTMTSRLSVIKNTRRRFVSRDILTTEINSKKKSEWRNKKMLFKLFTISHLPTMWMELKHDENEEIVCKQKFEHKMRNSTKNATRVKFQKTQIQMIENYQKWSTKLSSKKKISTFNSFVVNIHQEVPMQIHDEKKIFEKERMSFFIKRRSAESRKKLLTKTSKKFSLWLKTFSDLMRDLIVTNQKKHEVHCLLETWKNVFVTNIRDMSSTNLIEHKIPTYQHIIPRVVKFVLYTAKEVKWQKKNISLLEEAEIIMKNSFFWFSRTRFSRKSNEELRMMHAFCDLNEVTIKANQPMRRIESIFRNLTQFFVKYLFKANATNDFWTISVHLSHAYKLDISTVIESYCYLKMEQNTTKESETYFQLKNTVTGSISKSNSESVLSNVNSEHSVFNHFIDDDVKKSDILSTLINFLHTHYFPRLVWAKLTLNPKKCEFFTSKIQLLEHRRNLKDIRPSENKIEMFRKYSSSICKEKLERFLYMLFFFKEYIFERVDRSSFLRTTIVKETVITLRNDKKQSVKQKKKFLWTLNHERVFQKIKKTIMKIICSNEDDTRQWHLVIDAFKTEANEILFQFDNHSSEIAHRKKFLNDMQIVMFLNYQYNPSQTKYQTTEREALAVVKCLTEIKWLVQSFQYSIKLYTNHSALTKCLKSENTTDKIARWQLALSKFNLNIIHVSGRELAIADDLSKIIDYSFSSLFNFEFTMMIFSVTDDPVTTNGEQSLLNNSFFSLADHLSRIAGNSITTSDDTSSITKEDWRVIWQEWLDDFWYANIVKYKIRDVIKSNSFLLETIHKMSEKKTKRFLLIESKNFRELAYIEKSERYSRCLHIGEVTQILVLLHNVCEHFSKKITQIRAIEKYYWSTRFKNIFEFCRSCSNCQMLNSLKSTERLLSIVFIQSFDFVDTDYLKSISSIVKSEAKFIQIDVDYMCRFLFVNAMSNAISGNSVMFFERKMMSVFGCSRVVYHDNETHFKELFSKYLSHRKIR